MPDEKIRTIVAVSSNTYSSCELCQFRAAHTIDVPELVNHYIRDHDFELLHVGQQSERSEDGLAHFTVAVLGTTQQISKKTPARIDLPEKDPE